MLFYREPVLAPGVYTMEAVVYDALSSKATVRLSTVEVRDVDPQAVRMSSVVAVQRSEQRARAASASPGSPLYVGDQLLYPNMGEPVSNVELPFYFVVYPARGRRRDRGEPRAAAEQPAARADAARARASRTTPAAFNRSADCRSRRSKPGRVRAAGDGAAGRASNVAATRASESAP